jgi:two-component sensor histidine kinase
MSDLREAVLFMVIQEAVTNSIRHGLARSVTVSLDPMSLNDGSYLTLLTMGPGPPAKFENWVLGSAFLLP